MVSPVRTWISVTVPATGDGRSRVAFLGLDFGDRLFQDHFVADAHVDLQDIGLFDVFAQVGQEHNAGA